MIYLFYERGFLKLKDRIKEIRKLSGLTQVEFGKRIGVRGNTITNYENGLRNPTDSVILSICREFEVREEWLRNGSGEMCIVKTRNQEIQEFANDVMEDEDESFKKRLILALSKLDSRDWETLSKIAEQMQKGES